MKTITNSNPPLFVKEVCEAIKEGYYFTNDNFGSVTENTALTVVLQQKENIIFEQIEGHKVKVSDRNRNVFLEKVQDCVLSGFTLDVESVEWDSQRDKECVMMNENHPKGKTYTREYLDSLDWPDFKLIQKAYDIIGRARETITNQILAAQEKV